MPEDDPDMRPQVYLAGPVAAREDSGRAWREVVIDEYGDEFEFLNPLAKYDPDDGQEWSADRIVREDLGLIDAADAVLVRYNGAPTWGTPMEVHYADGVQTPVFIGWHADQDLSPWAQTFATAVRPSVSRAIDALRRYYRDEHIGWIEGVDPYDASDDIEAATADADPASQERPGPSRAPEHTGDDLAGAVAEDLAALLTDSRDTHGDAVANQEHIAEAWEWLFRHKLHGEAEITGADVARAMELVKLSRLTVGGYDVDHDRDVPGYACIAAACEVAAGNADHGELREHTEWSEGGDTDD